MIKRISITGSSSLLGKNVINLLNNHLLSVSSRKVKKLIFKKNNYKKKIQVFYGNLEKKKFVSKLFKNSECVINIAFDINDYKKNITIIRNLINVSNSSKTVKRFIHISTAVVVGKNYKDEIREDDNCNPINEYQKIKLILENELISNLTKNIELIIIRPTEIADFNNPKSTIFFFKKRCDNSVKSFFFRLFFNDRILNFVSIENVSNAIAFFVKRKKVLLKKKNIFFISEDKKKNNFTFYYNYFSNKKLSLFLFNSKLKKILIKFLFIVVLKKPNPFHIYSSKKIKKFGFKFKNNAKNHLKKIKHV